MDLINAYKSDSDNSENEKSQPEPVASPCEICSENPHKYKCPACQIKTCSIKCINEHKEK